MKTTLIRGGITGLATLLGASALAVGTSAVASADDYAKREDTAASWVVAVDDDDDDEALKGDGTSTGTGGNSVTGSRENGTSRDGTGVSLSGRDGTNSRMTAVSRDRDLSRRDLTKDWTRDGGSRHRDFKPALTNDRSRHDTRR